MKRQRVLVLILAGIVVFGAGAYYYIVSLNQSEVPPASEGTSALPVVSPPAIPTSPSLQTQPAPQTQPITKLYRNAEYKFTVEYPRALSSFEDFFTIETAIPHIYSCRIYDKSHDLYDTGTIIGSSNAPEDQCSLALPPPSFVDFMTKYKIDYFSDVREMRQIETADGTRGYFVHRAIPNYSITTGKTTESNFYYVILELDPTGKQVNRALRVALNPAGTTSCPNGVCEAGETNAACPADCSKDWDWGEIMTNVFATFRFVK